MRTTLRKDAKSEILDTLFSKTRQNLLEILLLDPDRPWYLTQLAKKLEVTPSTLQRDLTKLSAIGVFERAIDGGRVYFRANQSCPIYRELRNLFERTVEADETILTVLEPYRDKLLIGILIMSQTDSSHFIAVGRANFPSLSQDLAAHANLGLVTANIHCYWPEELSARLRSGQPLLVELLSREKEFLIGSMEDLNNLSPHPF